MALLAAVRNGNTGRLYASFMFDLHSSQTEVYPQSSMAQTTFGSSGSPVVIITVAAPMERPKSTIFTFGSSLII